MSDEVREYQATIRRIRSESERFLKRSEKLRDRLRDAGNDITCLRAEVLEQARLLGMSGEREAKLRARVEVLEMALRRIQATPHPSVAAQCAGCYSHQKTATYALEDAAP